MFYCEYLLRTEPYDCDGANQFKNFNAISKPRKQTAFAGKALNSDRS